MTKAIRIHETGGPEVLTWEDVEVGEPGDGEVRIRHAAIGLNFIDTYIRSGLYPNPGLPMGLGGEAAGVVVSVGNGVSHLTPGQRVAYAGGPPGSYAEERVMPAAVVSVLPDSIPDQSAAAMMLKGMTCHMLLHRVYPVKAGDTILVHAAAGGVGTILCQWAKHIGATVIGTVGSDEKAELAKAHGCDHPIIYTRENFTERVKEITSGVGVPVVYDSIGKDTFEGSMDCLQKFGVLCTFGNASGPVDPVAPLVLMQKGSISLVRPTLVDHIATPEGRTEASAALFDVVGSGNVSIEIGQTYPLSKAAQAHTDLESRKTTGSTVLLP